MLLHRIQTKLIETETHILYGTLDSHDQLVLAMYEKRSHARMQMDTNYDEYNVGSERLNGSREALIQQWGEYER